MALDTRQLGQDRAPASRGRRVARLRRGRLAGGILALAGILAGGQAAALDIVVSEPAVYDGDVLDHEGASLRITGEVFDAADLQEVTINGRPTGMGTRDLVVEGLEDEGTPFRGVVTLSGGDNPVQIRAVDAGGAETVLSFVVRVDPAALSGEVYALVVGVNDYQDGRISDLRFAEPDARSIVEALTHPSYGIARAENVMVLTGREATYRNVSRALEEHLVRKATRAQDVAIFYFAGHGAEGPHVTRGAAYYLVPHDAELTNLLSTGIDKGRLQFLWGAVGAQRKLFITDACHSGGLQDMRILSADGFETVEGFVTMAAARADQLALELPDLGHGLFTYALTQGLAGAADGDGDGLVSAAELGKYVQQRVQAMAAELGSEQMPVADIVPGAAATPVATSDGKPLPPWKPLPQETAEGYVGLVRVTLRFGQNERDPHVLVAMRDEEGDTDIEEVASTAIMGRFLAKKAPLRFIEASAVEGKLEGSQMELAFSDNPADIAAVARAVEADLMLSGRFTTEDTGLEDEDMRELLGTTIQSYQAHLTARVINASSGEVVQAKTVQMAATHINATMARRQALEKACQRLADVLRVTLPKKWAVLMRERPAGQIEAENLEGFEALERLERGLGELGPAVSQVSWRSFEKGSALYTFEPGEGASPQAVADRLRQAGLPGYKVGGITADDEAVSFWLK